MGMAMFTRGSRGSAKQTKTERGYRPSRRRRQETFPVPLSIERWWDQGGPTAHGDAGRDILLDHPLAVREEVRREKVDDLRDVTGSSD